MTAIRGTLPCTIKVLPNFRKRRGFYDFESRADGIGKLESLSAEAPERWSIAVTAGLTDEPGVPIQSIRDDANRRSQNFVL